MIRLMGMGSCFMQIKMSTRESGLMIKLTEKEFIHTQMEHDTMASGKKTNSMELEWNLGLTELSMKANTMMERRTGKVN